MSDFNREERYIVIKRKHIAGSVQERKLREAIEFDCGAPTIKCVVVEADWPEYEIVWKMIQDRVEGRPNELAAANERIRELEAEKNHILSWGDRATELFSAEREVSDKLEAALKYIEAYLESALDDEEQTGRLMSARMLLGDTQRFNIEVEAVRKTNTEGEQG